MSNQVIIAGTTPDLTVNVAIPPGQPLTTDLEVNGDPVDFANPLPVGVTNQVDVEVQNFPGNLATSDLQTSGNSTLSSIQTNTSTISGKLPSALASDRLKVDGSGVTQPVSGPLTDAQLRATAVPVSGTFFQATQPVSGTVSVSGTVTVDSEISVAATPTNAFTAPSAGSLYTLGMVYRPDTGLWNRAVGNESGQYIQGNTTVGSALNHNPVVVGGCNSSTVTRIQTDSTGRLRTMPSGAAPHADATTDVYTQLAASAFSSGVRNVKNSGGRVRHVHAVYTGATGSGLFLQLHNAADATTPTDSTIRMVWPINTSTPIVNESLPFDLPCSAGIKLAFSSTASTYTAATSETGVAITVHYA